MNTIVENLGEVGQVANGVEPAQQITPPDTAITSIAHEHSNEQGLAAQRHVKSSSEPQQSIPEQQLAEIHSFSRKLAKEHGVTAAIILGYLANRVQAIEGKRKDGLGYFTSIRKLAERYPYLPPGTIADNLARLRKNGVLKAENHNRSKYDRKLWYTFANAQVQKDAAWELIRFKVSDAAKFDVVEAVLLANLRYWVKENRKDDADYTWHRISASNLAKHLPFSASSVRRALENMLKEGVVKRQKCLGFDNAFVYRIQETINVNQSNPEVNHSKSDIYQPTSVVHQPKPENNNILEDSTEKTSLGRPCW